MGKDSPDPPDYEAAAQKTSDGQIAAIREQTRQNRANTYTPWGSQTWKETPTSTFDAGGYAEAQRQYQRELQKYNAAASAPTGKDANGQPIFGNRGTGKAPKAPDKSSFMKEGGSTWEQQINLDPEMQKALDSQQRLQYGRSAGAEQLLSRAMRGLSGEPNWGSLAQGGDRISTISQGDPSEWRSRAQGAVEELQAPQLARRREQAEAQLANQGITRGSEAYEAAMQDVADNETRAGLMAIDSGRSEYDQFMRGEEQQFSQDLRSQAANNMNRQTQLQEMLQKRGLGLNELNALLTGQQVNQPSFPGYNTAGVGQGANYMDAASQGYNAALGASNAENAQKAQTTSALASIAAAFAFSDERLKADIRTEGTLPSGIRLVSYRFKNGPPERFVGVLAQEVRRVRPKAVKRDPASGFLMVDYSKVN